MGVEPPAAAQASSTRAAATSMALFNGASIVEVMKAANWQTSQTFARQSRPRLVEAESWTICQSSVGTRERLDGYVYVPY